MPAAAGPGSSGEGTAPPLLTERPDQRLGFAQTHVSDRAGTLAGGRGLRLSGAGAACDR